MVAMRADMPMLVLSIFMLSVFMLFVFMLLMSVPVYMQVLVHQLSMQVGVFMHQVG